MDRQLQALPICPGVNSASVSCKRNSRAVSTIKLAQFICGVCLKLFFTRKLLIAHIFSHYGNLHPPQYICDECGFTSRNKLMSSIHRYLHNSNICLGSTTMFRPACVFSSETFPSRCSLVEHVFTHVSAASCPQYICTYCSEPFEDSNHLQFHVYKSFISDVCFSSPKTRLDNRHHKNHNCKLKFGAVNPLRNSCEDPSTADCVSVCLKNQERIFSCQPSTTCVYGNTSTTSSIPDIQSWHQQFVCNTCGFFFIDSYSLKTHFAMEHLECNECEQSPEKHKGNHFAEKIFSDELCEKRYTTKSRSVKTVRGKQLFACEVCGKVLRMDSCLIAQATTHTGERPYKCEICGNFFRYRGSLLSHMSTHNGEWPYTCEVCAKEFSKIRSLAQHMRIHTGEKPYSCDVCGKMFSHGGNFRNHMRIHYGERPFTCQVCDKSFTESHHLKDHYRVHTGERPFGCKVCGKSFRLSSHLKRHNRLHTGERPFSCDVCCKSFVEACTLKAHKRTHTGEKPFDCEVCGNSFAQRFGLKIHRRKHTGERPFRCDICGQSFRASNSLAAHKRRHTAEGP